MGNIAHSALIQARHRLWKKPMQLLFSLLAKKWDDEQRKMAPLSTGFCGLSNYAVDGVVWSVPETKENALSFWRNGSTSAWPQIRAVCLVNTESRIVRDIAFWDYPNGELTYAKDLWSSAPDFSLTIFDRLYYSASLLINWNKDTREWERIERHWLVRSRDTIRHEVLHTFWEWDVHVRLITSPQAKKKDPSLPEYWEARLIEREIDGKTYKFLTSLMDAQKYDASKIAAYYVERWEIELAYREVKQGLLEGELVLRSKLPELIEQEVWGMFLAYESDSYGDGQYGPRSSYIPKTIELSRNIPLYCISTDSLANGNTCNISRQTEVAQITSTVLYSSTQKTQKVSKSGQATVMKVSYKKYQ